MVAASAEPRRKSRMLGKRLTRGLIGAVAAIALAAIAPAKAADPQPITIGFGMALTGGLAPVGKSALLAMQIWEQNVNAQGGLLGRPVKLVYYDDQSTPANVPGIYTKLLDVDQVDLVVSGYATNMVAPAMPIDHAAQHDVPQSVRTRCEQRVSLSKLFFVHCRPGGRIRSKASRRGSSRLRWRRIRNPDAGDRRRRCRVPAQRDGRRTASPSRLG